MNHETLKQIIYDQHTIIQESKIIDRDYSFEENGNYVLIGLRRAGKTTLLYKRVKDLIKKGVDWKQIIYINFDDERLLGFTVKDFEDILLTAEEITEKRNIIILMKSRTSMDGKVLLFGWRMQGGKWILLEAMPKGYHVRLMRNSVDDTLLK